MPRDNTACQMCRSRKVKCDRARPVCSTCRKLKRECSSAVTSPEITWLKPDTVVDGAHEDYLQHENQLRQHGARARPLLSDRERDEQIAEILSAIEHGPVEMLLADLDIRFRCSLGNEAVVIGPFGLFRKTPATSIEPNEPQSYGYDQDDLALEQFQANDIPSISDTEPILNELSLPLCSNIEQPDRPDLNVDPDGHLYTVQTNNPSLPETSNISMDEFSGFLSPSTSYSFNVDDLDIPTIRVLLDRYQNALVPCFAPARIHSKSPWKALHIPKVYETLGELMVRGDSGNSKVSLFFAVLGASAFHLDITLPCSNSSEIPWRTIGNKYRLQAKARLKTCLQNLSSGQKLEDYQDILIALLSMVTLCVVSGEMEDAYAYLKDIEHLIAIYEADDIYDSHSIRMLHSTFLYLRTLQASVGIFGVQAYQRSINGHLKRLGNSLILADPHINLWSSLVDKRYDSSDMDAAMDKAPCHFCGKNKSTFEQIYSLPEPLFKLVSRATALAQRMERRRNLGKSAEHSDQLLLIEASQLETDICDWENDIASPDKGIPPPPCIDCISEASRCRARVALLYHFREAMHAALLIYFYRCVRSVDTHILQQFVEKTFEHLTRYGQFKRESNDPSSNLCWPGFIAGCEASNPKTRDKISAWFISETALTGIRMFEVAGEAVKQVWEARDLAKNRNLPWSKILMESSKLDRLVLS